MTQNNTILESESVSRILSREWLVAGVLSNAAFTLRPGETYISVNRPAVSSYISDVSEFIKNHPYFSLNIEGTRCWSANLRVADVKGIRVNEDVNPYRIDVEIEPRDLFTKSHAGIFTRLDSRTLKAGDTLSVMNKEISADDVLLEVRMQLTKLSTIEECLLKESCLTPSTNG